VSEDWILAAGAVIVTNTGVINNSVFLISCCTPALGCSRAGAVLHCLANNAVVLRAMRLT